MNQSFHSQKEHGPVKLMSGESLGFEERVVVGVGAVSVGGVPNTDSLNGQSLQTQAAAADQRCNDTEDQWHPIPFRSPEDKAAFFGFSPQNTIDGLRAWTTHNFGSAPSPVVVPVLPTKGDDSSPPGLVRSTSRGELSSGSEGDETMSSEDEIFSVGSADQVVVKGVSFNEQVRVLPIPPITAYTLEQRHRLYANHFELRENKIRGKKEYEFDNWDWRNATEEHSMAICPLSGELLHPAHL